MGGYHTFFFNWACDYGVRDDHYLFSPNKERLKNSHHWAGDSLVDCPTQLTLVTWICQLCSMTNMINETTQPLHRPKPQRVCSNSRRLESENRLEIQKVGVKKKSILS